MTDSTLIRNELQKDLEDELSNLQKKKQEVDESLKMIMKEEKIHFERYNKIAIPRNIF